MHEPDCRIVPYRPEYRAQVAELQKGLWSPSAELNAAYLDWKHLRNPYLSEPLVYLAMCGERVVGMRACFGTKWQFGAPRQTLVVPSSGDLIVAPEFRNRGIMTQLIKASLHDAAKKGYPYIFSMSAGPKVLLAQMAAGWRSIGPMRTVTFAAPKTEPAPGFRERLKKFPLLVSAYRRIRGHDSQWLAAAAEAPILRLAGFDERAARCHHQPGPHVVVEQSPRPAAMAELIERLGDDGRFRHVRDEEYFAWRFQNPRGGYRFLFWQEERLEGYLVVYACYYVGEARLSIVDWEGTSHRVCAGLMQALMQLAGADEFQTWTATLSEDKQHVLEEAGFQRVEESLTKDIATVLVRPTRDEPAEADWVLGNQPLLDLGNWDLRMVYSEGF
jgi:GNAT superfamily N-acetyltransferase